MTSIFQLLDAALDPETSNVQKSVKLQNIRKSISAMNDQEKKELCNRPGFLENVGSFMMHENDNVQKNALRILTDLTSVQDCMDIMHRYPGFLEQLLRAHNAKDEKARNMDAIIDLFNKVGVLNRGCEGLVNERITEQLKIALQQKKKKTLPCLIAYLASISQGRGVDRTMFCKDTEILRFLVEFIQENTLNDKDIRNKAVHILGNLANEQSNSELMAHSTDPDIVAIPLEGLESTKEGEEEKKGGLEGLLSGILEGLKELFSDNTSFFSESVYLSGNLARWEGNRRVLRERKMDVVLKKVLDSDKGDERERFNMTLALVNLTGADESGIEELGLSHENINMIVMFFKHMLRTPDADVLGSKWDLVEALQPLRLLLVSAKNRELLVEVAPLIVRSLKICIDTDDVLAGGHAVQAIAQFVFHPKVKEDYKKDEELGELLRYLKTNRKDGKWEQVSLDASGILWQLGKHLEDVVPEVEDETPKRSESKSSTRKVGSLISKGRAMHPRKLSVATKSGSWVMVSYNHKHQDQIRMIVAFLRANGIRVWVDFDEMHGDMIEAMARAVDNAHAVIVCLSQGYLESANCKRECYYAHKKEKPIIPVLVESGFKPSDWLDFITSMYLRHDASDKDKFEESKPKLLEALTGAPRQ